MTFRIPVVGPTTRIPTTFFLASIGLFVLALTQDGYYIGAGDPGFGPGWGLLIWGWMSLFSGVFAWLGNPLLLVGWALFFDKKYRAGWLVASSAMLFMLSFLLHTRILSDEGGGYSRIIGYGLGYWLWIASAAALLLADILAMRLPARVSTPVAADLPARF